MRRLRFSREGDWRPVLAILVSLALVSIALAAKPAATAPTTKPAASQPAETPQQQAARRTLEKYYADIYAEPLKSTHRLPRDIAIISLSRMDSPECTKALLSVFSLPDRDVAVEYLAWEALHARHTLLTPDERRIWISAGLKAANKGNFPGFTVTPLLRALAETSPVPFEGEPRKLALRVLRENDLKQPEDKAAINALRELVAAWHDLDLIRALIPEAKASAEMAARVGYVLRGLPDAPPEADGPTLVRQWDAWVKQHGDLRDATDQELKPYTGKATAFPPPQHVDDPGDKKWRAELEIGKLTVTDFDLVWCIDSTGSMNERNQRVAAETRLVMRVCSLVSERARCGTIYYRHETDPALTKSCCDAAKASPFYRVKGYPLTTDAKALSVTMAAEHIPRPSKTEGNTHPGSAYHGALHAAMTQMNWSKGQQSRRAIIMVGDSYPTPGSEAACETLSAKAKADGFIVEALVTGRAESTWPPAVKAAGGKLFTFTGANDATGAPTSREARLILRYGTADPFADVVAEVFRQCIDPAYRDRIAPLMRVLHPFAKAMVEVERRKT